MLKIGITQRVDIIESRQETRDALDQQWSTLLTSQELLMIPIPNIAAVSDFIETLALDGILLSGGNDHPSRTRCETICVDYCVKHRLPLLGICHGMQFIGQYFGAHCIPIENHVGQDHKVYIAENCYEIPQGCMTVNSFHRFTLDKVPENFVPLATDKAGQIEAMHHRSLPIVTFMWHPERPPFLSWFPSFLKHFYEKH